jgi:hypothetical protein
VPQRRRLPGDPVAAKALRTLDDARADLDHVVDIRSGSTLWIRNGSMIVSKDVARASQR